MKKEVEDRFTAPMYMRLWIPAMMSSLGWAFSDMADAVVVGQRLGTVGLAAIGLILPVYMINCMMAHGLGLGGSASYGQLLGEGRIKEAEENFVQTLWMALFCSISTAVLGSIFLTPLLSILGTRPSDGELYKATWDYLQILILATPLFYLTNLFNYYLRNDGSQKRAGIGSVAGNLCDIGMNLVLVLGLGMGTRGAALSTVIGQVITLAVYLPGFFLKDHVLRFALPGRFWFRKAVRLLYTGISVSIQYFYQMIFFLLCNNILIRLGGETGVAVFDVLQNTSYLILYLYEGTSRAMQPLLSTYMGEHNQVGRKNTARLAVKTGVAAGGLLILMTELWPAGMCFLFGISSPDVQKLAFLALRIYGLGAFFGGLNILICNYYQACGQGRAALLMETLRGAILLLPAVLLFSRLGLYWFWFLFPVTEIGSIVIFACLAKNGRFSVRDIEPERVFQRTILSSSEDLGSVCQELEEFCLRWQASMSQQYFVTMAVEELGMAILEHGFCRRRDGYIQITAIAGKKGIFELHMRDNALAFDPFSLESGCAGKSGEDSLDINGMGVLVIKKKAKSFYYRRYQSFNSLIVRI